MKSDLDNIMEQKNLDAILVSGGAAHNPPMYYFTGNVHISEAELVKLRGQRPVLFCKSMEREEAALSGLPVHNLAKYHLGRLMQQANGNPALAYAHRYRQMLSDLGFTKGRLSVYGEVEAGQAYSVFTALQQLMPEIEVVGEIGDSAILQAMETKDADEIEHMRQMGQVTVEVVGRVAEFLQSHKARDGKLVKADGSVLTIADVKRKINLWAIELGVENPHGVIFAIGRDAGIPHSTGNPADALELGKTIVFDIYLQQPGGGYHYDFTRAWCLGYAPPAEQQLYDDVRAVFDEIMGGLEVNAPLYPLHNRTCELFEAQGHATIRQDPMTTEGYVHSLGHGLGLHVHERPGVRDEGAMLKPGVVVTIEPGLYYPERGMGCRIEDTIYVHPDGRIEILAEYPYDLVLPIQGE